MACCGKSEVDTNDVKTQFHNDHHSHFSSLRLADQIKVVVKVQAAVRGFLARRRIWQYRRNMGGGRAMMGMMDNQNYGEDMPVNYDNPDVIVIVFN